MTILIVDFDTVRRTAFAALVRKSAPAITIVSVGRYGEAEPIATPRLAFWHVGRDQATREADHGAEISAQVRDFLGTPGSWVAAFTGGTMLASLVAVASQERDRFALRLRTPRAEVPPEVAVALGRTVRTWLDTSGHFGESGLPIAWLGMDPLLEAKLDFLTARLEGHEAQPDSVEALEVRYPLLDLSEAAVPKRDIPALTSLRDSLFDR